MARPSLLTFKRCWCRNSHLEPSSFWTIWPPTKRPSSKGNAQGRMSVLVLAAIQSRPQFHRNGVLEAQSTPAPDRSAHIHRHVQRTRRDLRPILTRRMLELLHGCRICRRLKAGRFNNDLGGSHETTEPGGLLGPFAGFEHGLCSEYRRTGSQIHDGMQMMKVIVYN